MNKEWQDAYEESIRCIRCGYCQPTCPTYMMTGIEHSVARGRNFLARLIYEGEIEFTKDFKQPIFECLLCGACNTNCAPVVKTQEIMTAARQAYIQKQGQPPLQRYVFRERKMENLQKTSATVMLSSCPGCLVQLSYGVRKFNVLVTVKHIV